MLDLLIAFWEDYYQRNPIETRRGKDGKVVFANTGDSLIDKWEKEIAQGLEPDLLEGLSPEERERERKAREKLFSQKVGGDKEGIQDGFSESYVLENAGVDFLGRR